MPLALARPVAVVPPASPRAIAARPRLGGRGALITGATGAVGLAVARTLAEAGADLVLHASPDGGAGELHARLAAAHGVRVARSAADLADAAAAGKLVMQAVRQLGAIDIVVQDGDRHGAAAGAILDAVVPAMASRGWGRVVTIAGPESLTRFGLVERSRAAALRGAGAGVTANVLRLGAAPADVSRVASLVALLCDEGAGLLTGLVLPVDTDDSAGGRG